MYILLLTSFFAALSVANPVSTSGPYCINLDVPVCVETQSYPLVFPAFKNGYEATEFLLQFSKRDPAGSPSQLLGTPSNISTTFSINVDYCTPVGNYGKKAQTVQVLTHGLGFDKSYWNFQAPNGSTEYDYVRFATEAGYSTLSYDRIGNGLSTLPDPYNVQQAQVELAVLVQLTKLLKAGKISPKVPKPSKVVQVGHSYGSFLANGLAASYSDLADGIILTGYSLNNTWQTWFAISTAFHLASENQPARFGNASSGALTWGDQYSNQYAFLSYPYFDPAVLAKAEAGKFPFSVGEFFTQGLVTIPAPTFKKPVLLMAAEFDLIFCGVDCKGIANGPETAAVFSAAKPLEVYIQPNTGHGMNLHYNATGWYGVVQDFLGKNGL